MSYEFKGTPSPWVVFGESSENAQHCVDAETGGGVIEICEVWGTVNAKKEDLESWANARAIAELPELISVLAGIVERWDSLVPEDEISEEHKRARAALTKATGGDDAQGAD